MARKGENIYKRKDGRWEARYIKPESGSYGYCYGKTYREAKGKAEEAIINRMTGQSSWEDCRFSTYCSEWREINRQRVKRSTYAKYSAMLDNHILPFFGHMRAGEIYTFTVSRFSDKLISKKGLSGKTVRDTLALLRSIIDYASSSCPALKYCEIVYPRLVKKEIRVLSLNEQSAFVDYLMNGSDRCRLGVLLALLTGMRIGELCALKQRDICLDMGLLTVSHTMQRVKREKGSESKTEIIISSPKSEASGRVIPLTPMAEEVCLRLQCDSPDGYILTGNNSYIEPRTLQYRFKRYTRECGIEALNFHALRHTFATRCVEVGFEIKSLSEVLGHSSPRVTLERYVHPSIKLKRENMEKLAAIGW